MTRRYEAKPRPAIIAWVSRENNAVPGLKASFLKALSRLSDNPQGTLHKNDPIGRLWFTFTPLDFVGAHKIFLLYHIENHFEETASIIVSGILVPSTRRNLIIDP